MYKIMEQKPGEPATLICTVETEEHVGQICQALMAQAMADGNLGSLTLDGRRFWTADGAEMWVAEEAHTNDDAPLKVLTAADVKRLHELDKIQGSGAQLGLSASEYAALQDKWQRAVSSDLMPSIYKYVAYRNARRTGDVSQIIDVKA